MGINLLIVGAGIYGTVAKEIAESMGRYDKIGFIDDSRSETPLGDKVIGKFEDINRLSQEYTEVIVAIGNPEVRLDLINRIEKTACRVATLISPRAYVSPSASVLSGAVIEPMAVIHAGVTVSRGCIISAGAVVNHASICSEGVHVDCNATVSGYVTVPSGLKITSGEVYGK